MTGTMWIVFWTNLSGALFIFRAGTLDYRAWKRTRNHSLKDSWLLCSVESASIATILGNVVNISSRLRRHIWVQLNNDVAHFRRQDQLAMKGIN